ncbi:Glycosyltransferase [Cronobacter dublinensis 1210]|uniref:Glycosyltransferase n=1 Tax=Cronobacter dublinensis 1210 TaxID=1208656 RepID=A0ABP1W5C8_9ENTR|nr:Glycosyltransferase [Cronobacter dublinensis 1210]
MSDTPLLSIIVAVYNGEKFLSAFFDSIKSQQLESVELIVVDDGSTDRSAEITESYRAQFPRFQHVKQENQASPRPATPALRWRKGNIWRFRISMTSSTQRFIRVCWTSPRGMILMSRPATAPISMTTAARRRKFSPRIAFLQPASWMALPGCKWR